ncbi:acyl-CoA dehydrogenase family protein [Streptomyces sp. NPDC058877]|uniref:acyl-CoA dehydrogenase family protein n=1 Tax=Streptomyces sp. NPDC058877 TaxID=3346665 RepID=UPI0036CDA3F7
MPDRPPRLPSNAATGPDLPPDATGADVWAALGAAGHLRRAYRGGDVRAGIDPDGLADVLAAVDARWSIPATLSVSVPLATGLPVLATGRSAAVEHCLERVLSGRATVALAATDDSAGTDLTALRTQVMIEEDSVTVTGTKEWITNSTTAEAFLVLARHRPGRHFAHFTWVLVPADAPGVAVKAAPSALYAASGVGHVSFDGVRLPRERIVGRVGLGLPVFARHIAAERMAGVLWGIALCRRVLDDTWRRLRERAHGEGMLADLGTVRQRLAACLVRLEELRALADRYAPEVAHQHDPRAAALLKAAAGTTVPYILGECAQLWGAAGFADGGIQEIRAQAALFGIGGGATEVVRETVADNTENLLASLGRKDLPW